MLTLDWQSRKGLEAGQSGVGTMGHIIGGESASSPVLTEKDIMVSFSLDAANYYPLEWRRGKWPDLASVVLNRV